MNTLELLKAHGLNATMHANDDIYTVRAHGNEYALIGVESETFEVFRYRDFGDEESLGLMGLAQAADLIKSDE